jgi:hypothetical protein
VPSYPQQLLGDGRELPFECEIGPTATLLPGQGYMASEPFVCTVDDDHPLREYYGVFEAPLDSCVPLSCETRPETPELGNITGCFGTQPDGTECPVICGLGFAPEPEPAFVCDRGVYPQTITCERAKCADGTFFQERFVPPVCDYGFNITGPSPLCVATGPNQVDFAFPFPSCAPLPCVEPPPVENAAYDGVCNTTRFGETCPLTCMTGHMLPSGSVTGGLLCSVAEGPRDPYPTGMQASYTGDTICAPVACSAGNRTAFDAALSTTCKSGSLVFEDECTVTCLVGWSPGGRRTTIGNQVTYECTVQNDTAALFPVGEECKQMECIPPLTAYDRAAPSLSCAAITDPGSENLPHGTSCTLSCPSGYKAVDGSPALACEKGQLRGCVDSSCMELTDTLPLCVPEGSTYQLVDAISTGVVATTVGANFFAEKEALATEKFAEAVHTHVILKSEQECTVSITGLEITELSVYPLPDGRRNTDNATAAAAGPTEAPTTGAPTTEAPTTEAPPTLAPAQRTSKVYAPALVVPESGAGDADDPSSGFGAVYDVFQLLATEPSAAEEFRTGLQAALLNSFPLVVVEEVVVDAPRMTKTWVEIPPAPTPQPTPAPDTAPEEDVGSGWGVYIFILFVLLAAAGGGGYYYTQVFLPQQKAKEAAGEADPLTGEAPAEAEGERSMV